MANFTPSSGIGWTNNHDYSAGTFAFDLETTPTGPDPAANPPGTATAVFTQNIPYSITSLEFKGGDITMQGDAKAAVLLTVSIIGDPASGDSGSGVPGGAVVLKRVLNVAGGQPANLEFEDEVFNNIQSIIPVPPDGSPYKFQISVQFAGAQWPMDAEITLNGTYTATPAT